jgi:hypothetical protein
MYYLPKNPAVKFFAALTLSMQGLFVEAPAVF